MKTAPTETKTTEIEQFPTEFLKDSGAHQTQPIYTQKDLNMPRFGKILKATIAFSLLLPATFFLKPKAAVAGGGFANSCTDIILYNNSPGWLYANCRRADGTFNAQARINLNDWITNNNGNLGWQPNGNFIGSCNWETDARSGSGLFPTGLNKQSSGFIGFHAPCRNNAGSTNITTDINLNDRIVNENGNLKYGG